MIENNEKVFVDAISDNYDENNITEIRKNSMKAQSIYTMVQENSSCGVDVKASSREKCVEALLG